MTDVKDCRRCRRAFDVLDVSGFCGRCAGKESRDRMELAAAEAAEAAWAASWTRPIVARVEGWLEETGGALAAVLAPFRKWLASVGRLLELLLVPVFYVLGSLLVVGLIAGMILPVVDIFFDLSWLPYPRYDGTCYREDGCPFR